MIRTDARAWLLWAVLILLLPLKWLISAALAAAVHETFHIAAILCFGGRIRNVRIGAGGAVIEASDISGYQELISALAGPLGSFLLALMIRKFPVLGFCALAQGCYNLIPVYPMDGGRAVRCLLEILCPRKAARYGAYFEIISIFCLFLLAALISFRYSSGIVPFAICLPVVLNVISRKRP